MAIFQPTISGGGGSAPAHYIEKYNNNGILSNRYTINSLSGITTIGNYALMAAFIDTTNTASMPDFSNITTINHHGMYDAFWRSGVIGAIDLSSVTSVDYYSLYYMIASSTNITSVDLSSLQTINAYQACDNMCRESNVVSVNFSSLQMINNYQVMRSVCYGCSNLTSVNLSNLTTLNGYLALGYAFQNCTSLTSLNLGKLKIITGTPQSGTSIGYTCEYFCAGCTSLTTVDLSSLEVVFGYGTFYYAFDGCTNLSSLNIDSLVEVSYSNRAFQSFARQCTSLTVVKFNSLKVINQDGLLYNAFQYCTGLTDLYFPALKRVSSYTNVFLEMIQYCSGVTIHFTKNLDPQSGSTAISSLQGYPTFSGANTVLAFDLPSTVELTGANSQVYERSPKNDTATALAWRKQDTGSATNLVVDWTPFYTSGTTDPAVSDTIYSDSACTTAVTTISSIA